MQKFQKNLDLDLSILVIDDDPITVELLKVHSKDFGFKQFDSAHTANRGLELIRTNNYSCILLDLGLPDRKGEFVLHEFLLSAENTPIVIITADTSQHTHLRCLEQGAIDFLEKPISKARIHSLFIHLTHLYRALSTNSKQISWSTLNSSEFFHEFITQSPLMHRLFRKVEQLAPSGFPVLLNGESGVGKELFAKVIHKLSKRNGQFVPINVAGLDGTLFSDVLFGHKKGSYTGAHEERQGLIRSAENGSLFLDEIGDLSLENQVKLLRFLQEGEYYPLGSDLAEKSTARIIVATNINLITAVAEGRFRQDLYFRLLSHQVSIPSLRERQEDIPLLFNHFVEVVSNNLGLPKLESNPQALSLITRYPFPGNIRELQALANGYVIHGDTKFNKLDYIRSHIEMHQKKKAQDELDGCVDLPIFDDTQPLPKLETLEKQLIMEALKRTDGNQTLAALMIGISQPSISRKIKEFQQTE